MPPTMREQVELDELLSDIYLGIETLPDKSTTNQKYYTNNNNNNHQHTYDQSRGRQVVSSSENTSSKNRQHKGSTATPEYGQQQQQHQSLASILTSTTPRRVRIVEPPDKRAKQVVLDERGAGESLVIGENENLRRPQQVKYVNTNKLIYHQEKNPDDDYVDNNYRENSYYNKDHHLVSTTRNYNESDDDINNNERQSDDEVDDLDGKTRVEYYHTTWLDRQLGRASKRRSSKELNERQVKEKAMIEELKRSLKNGAITLRQSFKGGRNKNKPSEQQLEQTNNNSYKIKRENNVENNSINYTNKYTTSTSHKVLKDNNNNYNNSSVISSGLATVPRNYQHNNNNSKQQQQQSTTSSSPYRNDNFKQHSNTLRANNNHNHQPNFNIIKSSFYNDNKESSINQTAENKKVLNSKENQNLNNNRQQSNAQMNYSRTLPHKKSEHQLLQSHYRGGGANYTNSLARPTSNNSDRSNSNNIHYGNNKSLASGDNSAHAARYPQQNQPNYQYQQQQQQQTPQTGNTISSIPSATEVVRSALSRSSSQISLNQLNKTINLLPNSPPPCNPSPMTPTQQLKPASPSLSPSPIRSTPYNTEHQHQTHRPNDYYSQSYQRQQQQQPIYSNPHASLMQHRMEEQQRQPYRNQASIREFNELDSLLRSLSPASTGTTSTHITAGFNSKPAQPSFGYGFSPAPTTNAAAATPYGNQQQQQQSQGTGNILLTAQRQNIMQPANNDNNNLYARVQKQQQPFNKNNNNEQTTANYLKQNYMTNNNNNNDQFTIDVTNKKLNSENCLQNEQRSQNLSEFEPPIELIPSMEDYQNISRLNPVKNHYWYKPYMSRERAIELLKDKPQGTFIVRDSTSFQGAFGLAVKVSKLPKNVINNASLRNPNDPSAELIRHFLIEPTSGGVRLKGYANEPVFGSLPALIYQHSLVELALPCKLVIPRADIEDRNFNHKQKQFYDEFIASKEIAKHTPYEVTSPNGGYRRYPGDVYVHNEHRIIFE